MPAVPHQPGDRGRRDPARDGVRYERRDRRRRPLPRVELRARRHRGGPLARRRRRDRVARRRAPRAGSTPSSCPAASPTATTCVPAPSPASRRSWRPWPSSPPAAGPVVGHLQRLPGAHRGGAAARRAAEEPGSQVPVHDRRRSGWRRTDSVLTPEATAGDVLRMPINHFEGNYTCATDTLAELQADGPDRAPLRRQPERFGRRHRRHLQRGPQRRRAHAPPRARLRTRCWARPTAVAAAAPACSHAAG